MCHINPTRLVKWIQYETPQKAKWMIEISWKGKWLPMMWRNVQQKRFSPTFKYHYFEAYIHGFLYRCTDTLISSSWWLAVWDMLAQISLYDWLNPIDGPEFANCHWSIYSMDNQLNSTLLSNSIQCKNQIFFLRKQKKNGGKPFVSNTVYIIAVRFNQWLSKLCSTKDKCSCPPTGLALPVSLP